MRNILERLGTPEEIVAAEASPTRPDDDTSARALPRPGIGPVEILGILFLTAGAVLLPFVGPLIGLVFVWLSTPLDDSLEVDRDRGRGGADAGAHRRIDGGRHQLGTAIGSPIPAMTP